MVTASSIAPSSTTCTGVSECSDPTWPDIRPLLSAQDVASPSCSSRRTHSSSEDFVVKPSTVGQAPDSLSHLHARLIVVLILNILLSGGILNGIAPLQARLVKDGVLAQGDAALLYVNGFEIETIGTVALGSIVMGLLGPRWTAVTGLFLECLGYIGLVLAQRGSEGSRLLLAEIACGMIGLGGTALYFGSVSLAEAFRLRQGSVAGCLAAAWQVTSCGFMPLGVSAISVDTFCMCYAALALFAVPWVVWALPQQSHGNQKEKQCKPMLLDKTRLRGMLGPLADFKMWGFIASFAWVASACTWGTSIIYLSVVKANISDARREEFIAWSPAAMLLSVFAPGLVGASADRYGIALPGFCTLLLLAAFLATVQVGELWTQWAALWFLSSTVGAVYALQVVYLAERAPGPAFGFALAVSVLVQSLVQVGAIALVQPDDSSDIDLRFATSVWALPLVILFCWPVTEHFAKHRN
eukprot:TRINITY_DN19319_c0_g1_i1.p1 TRINITY_DN19319_c0_g1~~TRINITY_DN19319_c0_g1_i1.p1  ORF type:complete len:469 (+),score=54.71 TRINITY_DN19319_c0_g1_i1:116-1522(+)